MEGVRARGDEALLEYTERFDRVRPEPTRACLRGRDNNGAGRAISLS